MNVLKLEVLIINHDKLETEDIKSAIEEANYPNDCISPIVENIQSVEIGEWSDDHPLNRESTHKEEYDKMFHKIILEKILGELENFDARIADVFFNADKENFEELEKRLLDIMTE